MTYYVVYIFTMAGLSGNINLIASGVQYALFIIFTTVMFFYIDRTGRRPLLIYGALAMAACLGWMPRLSRLVRNKSLWRMFFRSLVLLIREATLQRRRQ